jgi:hypothetical protein
MKHKIYTQIMISTVVFLIVISFFILNIYKITENNDTKLLTLKQEEEKEKKDLYFLIYDLVSILFIVLLIIFTFYQGCTKGMIYALFIWAFFVIATPIPESGLLITLPLKRFFNLPMTIVQIFVSIFALIIIFYLNWVANKEIKTNVIGQLFNLLLENKNYGVFIVSIISSILATQIIENFIDKILMNKKILFLNYKLIGISFFIIIYFILINGSFHKIQYN